MTDAPMAREAPGFGQSVPGPWRDQISDRGLPWVSPSSWTPRLAPPTIPPMRRLLLVLPTALLWIALASACGETTENECGPTAAEPGTDGTVPQDPADPEIVTACEALCQKRAAIQACPDVVTFCVDRCRLASCSICPGTLVAEVECETAQFDPAKCTCGTEGPICPDSPACNDARAAQSMCGG